MKSVSLTDGMVSRAFRVINNIGSCQSHLILAYASVSEFSKGMSVFLSLTQGTNCEVFIPVPVGMEFLHIVFSSWLPVLKAILKILEIIKFGAPICKASCQPGESSHYLAIEAFGGSGKKEAPNPSSFPPQGTGEGIPAR